MKYSVITDLKETIRQSTLHGKISEKGQKRFRENVKVLFDNLQDGQSEDTQRGFLKTFMEKTFFEGRNLIVDEINGKDLSVLNGMDINDSPCLFIETKSTNKHEEMVSADSLQAKGFYETVLYYMRERSRNNDELKHIIITDINCWCIIDALEYDRVFWRNREFRRKYEQFCKNQLSGNTSDFFYYNICAPFVRETNQAIHYVFFNLKKEAFTQNGRVRSNVSVLYKLLSPKYLLKQYELTDNNELSRGFYLELLHIMGLEEVEQDNTIRIERKKAGERHDASILELTMEQLRLFPEFSHFPVEGVDEEEKLYETALTLTITWTNRLLFMKLLEGQLMRFHEGKSEYSFLQVHLIRSFRDLNVLFFQLLAKQPEERLERIKSKYSHVPYLNSSLFEMTEVERASIRIAELEDGLILPLYSGSVLRRDVTRIRKDLNTLEYLLCFLNAYDFGSDEQQDDENENEHRQLISASVLGLIFEKINGYKDGSVFTPSRVTMTMSREVVRQAIIDKFNIAHPEWHCQTWDELYNKISDKQEANQIINNITVCDPSVGSGHFLVSVLNELIAAKADLGILLDDNGRVLRDYFVDVQNDELVITNDNGEDVLYQPSVHYHESQLVQETIFREKRQFIENSLFGVDINPNSVSICRLRLWIELLKHTYYDRDTHQLQTLPNIDINIKCGNSLASKYPPIVGQSIEAYYTWQGDLRRVIDDYKQLVASYKNNAVKRQRREMMREIMQIKRLALDGGMEQHLYDRYEAFNLAERRIHAMEWMFEFPELLDADGVFQGFDVIIGNPPYIPLGTLGTMSDYYNNHKRKDGNGKDIKIYETYDAQGDIYTLFFDLGRQLARKGGIICYITSNKWMRTNYGEKTRAFFSSKVNPKWLVNLEGCRVFSGFTVEPTIILFTNESNQLNTRCTIVKRNNYKKLRRYVRTHFFYRQFSTSEPWLILTDEERSVLQHIRQHCIQLKDERWNLTVKFGIKTGNNNVFLIDKKTRENILASCETQEERERTEQIIHPVLRGRDILRYGYLSNHYLIATFPSRNYDITQYPALKHFLTHFAENNLRERGYAWIAENEIFLQDYCRQKLQQRGQTIVVNGQTIHNTPTSSMLDKSRKRTSNQWFETQDNIAYWAEFEKPKLVWKRIGSDVRFAYDESKYLALDSTCIATGKYTKYLCGILNSKVGRYQMKYTPETGTGDSLVSVQAFYPLYVPLPTDVTEKKLSMLIDEQIIHPSEANEQRIDEFVYQLYQLAPDDIHFIESALSQQTTEHE